MSAERQTADVSGSSCHFETIPLPNVHVEVMRAFQRHSHLIAPETSSFFTLYPLDIEVKGLGKITMHLKQIQTRK